MYRMLEHDVPGSYVLATNQTYTVRSFVELAFKAVDIDVQWKGSGVDEVGTNAATGDVLVEINPRFFRPAEVELLLGDASKAKKDFGWEAKMPLHELCRVMVEADLLRNARGASF